MVQTRKLSNRILDNGGVFIFFCGPRTSSAYVHGARRWVGTGSARLEPSGTFNVDNWSVLSVLGEVDVADDHGLEIQPPDGESAPWILGTHFREATFTCSLAPSHRLRSRWVTLATSKFGDPVAGVIVPPEDDEKHGYVFLLPRVEGMTPVLRELLEEFLPGIVPRLLSTIVSIPQLRSREFPTLGGPS